MRIFWLAMIAGGFAVAGCGGTSENASDGTAAPLTVEDVLARHVEAMGGAAAIEALRNLRIAAEITEPDFTVTGDYRAQRTGRMRVDIYAGGDRVFSEGIDDAGAWQQSGPDAPIEASSAEGRAALARGIDSRFFGLHDLAARGQRAEIRPRETIDGTDYFVIQVAERDGASRRYYINPGNWLIERMREDVALHPDIASEQRQTETTYGAYRPYCGVLQSLNARTVDLESGAETQRSRPLSIACNVESDRLALDRGDPAPPPPAN